MRQRSRFTWRLNGYGFVAFSENTALPVVSGLYLVGGVVSTTNGVWSKSASFTYQWNRNGSPIAGATSSTYTLVAADGGTLITATVFAHNSSGIGTATSLPTPIIAFQLGIPSGNAFGLPGPPAAIGIPSRTQFGVGSG